MAASKKKVKAELSEEEVSRLVRIVVDETKREGMVLVSKLATLGVGKQAKPEVLEALTAIEGIEVGKRALRVPVRAQIAARLDAGAALAMKTIGSAAAAATKKEIADVIDAMIEAGEAKLVVRGSEIALVGTKASTDTIDDDTLDRLERAITELGKSIKLARKRNATLLRRDVHGALGAFTTSATKTPSPSPSLDDVLLSVERHRESTSGLTFVPTLVRALEGTLDREEVHAALVRAANAGVVELRPESGMGRLTPEDLQLCLPGPQGSRLSWVRRVAS